MEVEPVRSEALVKEEHYFSEEPTSRVKPREIRLLFNGRIYRFHTAGGVFATEGLDPGTALLVENMVLEGTESVLDLGCGWGPIGIAAGLLLSRGKVVMVDVNRRALWLAKKNVREAGLSNVEIRAGSLYESVGEEKFDVIATNPPYHAGRETILRILDEAPAHLREGGRLLMVGKGAQGMIFYQGYLEEHWTDVQVLGRRGGYRVVMARHPKS